MVKLAKQAQSVEMRKVYCQTMMQMAQEDPRVVALDCDLVSPIGMGAFQKQYPERMFDCGIMEGNMAGLAAGMSARGCIPFAHTFACFQSRKCIDQLFLSAGFAELNVKLVGSDPGIMALYNGASHMGLEDMGILQNIPNLTLIEPCDTVQLASVLHQVKDTYGLHYIRMNRKNANTVYEEGTEFQIGKGLVLKEGGDVTIIASGIMVELSLKAAELLGAEGIHATVIDMFTWKPLDEELVLAYAEKTGAIVTAENHRIATGLGSAVANLLSEHQMVPLGRTGVGNVYGEVGVLPYLLERFEMRPEDIAQKAKQTIARK
ncbi:MAG: transketolase C-terminal domain-containing protein [Firmicutes bacterium]|mgnify:CR=1 FL=1|nr:transketolase C-terminal domain-containing protein [Bacillota bacterium]